MAKYYFGRDSTKEYWINLDQVSFIQKEKDKLILKMLNGMNIFIDGEDVDAFTQMLWSETVNWDEEYKDNDKRHNQEDISEDCAWLPIDWELVEDLLDNYRSDWEGNSPNGVDLDSLYQNLKEAYDSYLRMFFPDFSELRVQSEF